MKKKLVLLLLSFIVISQVLAWEKMDSMRVRKGNPFTINLPSNPTTGYCWKLVKDNASKSIDSLSFSYIPKNEKAVGGGGFEVWSFRANKRGEFILNFIYLRPWEEVRAVKERKVRILVY